PAGTGQGTWLPGDPTNHDDIGGVDLRPPDIPRPPVGHRTVGGQGVTRPLAKARSRHSGPGTVAAGTHQRDPVVPPHFRRFDTGDRFHMSGKPPYLRRSALRVRISSMRSSVVATRNRSSARTTVIRTRSARANSISW